MYKISLYGTYEKLKKYIFQESFVFSRFTRYFSKIQTNSPFSDNYLIQYK